MKQPVNAAQEPLSGVHAVTVNCPGGRVLVWSGYAENPSDALACAELHGLEEVPGE